MSIIGKTYMEKGRPVLVLIRWLHRQIIRKIVVWRIIDGRVCPSTAKDAPRNVLIRRQDGSEVVRPFRGLRCQKEVKETPVRGQTNERE
jgi:hypothetical protein